MSNLLEQLQLEKQRAAEATAVDVKCYGEILARHDRPRKGDGAALARLMVTLGIDDTTMRAHLEARRRADAQHVTVAKGKAAAAERPGVQQTLSGLIAQRDKSIAEWNAKITPVAANLSAIDQSISSGSNAADDIARIEGEYPTCFGRVPPPPPAPRAEPTPAELQRQSREGLERMTAQSYAASFRDLTTDAARMDAWRGLADDAYLLLAKAFEKGWIDRDVTGKPPPREIHPPVLAPAEQVRRALRDAPPGVVAVSAVSTPTRRIDPRDALHG